MKPRTYKIALRAIFAMAALAIAFAGCATRRDVVIAKLRGRGTQRTYPVSVDQAWTISKTILELEPTEKVEEHRSDGYMVTSDVATALTPSTYIGVFIEPDGTEAKVTIVTRRRTPTQGYATLSEGAFHRKFAELLKLIAVVGPLPSGESPASSDAGTPRLDGSSLDSPAEGGDGGS